MVYFNELSHMWIVVILITTLKWQMVANVLEEYGASIFRVEDY
jgi:hypothetical protein